MQLYEMLAGKPIDFAAVGAYLDSLDTAGRVAEIRTIPGRLQAALFAAAQGKRAVAMEHFVPAQVPAKRFIRHFGRNSLPLFSDFEKRFALPQKDATELWGYNHSPAMGLVGPGHFVVENGPDPGEVSINYYRIPPVRLDEAPALRSNTSWLSFFVYGNMVDVMRGVSEHVSVGRAIKNHKETNNYFLLCRQDVVGAGQSA